MNKEIKIGNIKIGGGNRIAIQSMLDCPTTEIELCREKIRELAAIGCDLIRVAVPDKQSAFALPKLKEILPIIADIHFDYRLALLAIENGADKIRINPGNIGNEKGIAEVAKKAREYGVPIRVGANSGSAKKNLVESCLENIHILEKYDFDNIVVSLKSSDVRETIKSYREISNLVDYPLHLGVTEAGLEMSSAVKSSIGIGNLLLDGIGDTIRVSLTGDKAKEVQIAKEILIAVGLSEYPEIISCPTCGRTKINIEKLAKEVYDKAQRLDRKLKIAVMGCVVNGPGEAKNADFGIAGGDGKGIIFARGEIIKTCQEKDLVNELFEVVENGN